MTEEPARVILVRHGEAANSSPDGRDFSRPLTFKGQKDIKLAGQFLSDAGLVPDLIYCSNAKRTSETAAILSRETGYSGVIQPKPQLYNCTPDVILKLIEKNQLPEMLTCIIAHNPGLTDTARSLIPDFHDGLSPGATVVMKLDNSSGAGKYKLIEYLIPK